MSDKTGWEGRDQQLGTRIGTVWTLSQALGQAKGNIYALESLDGYIVSGCGELKRKFWLSTESESKDAGSDTLLVRPEPLLDDEIATDREVALNVPAVSDSGRPSNHHPARAETSRLSSMG